MLDDEDRASGDTKTGDDDITNYYKAAMMSTDNDNDRDGSYYPDREDDEPTYVLTVTASTWTLGNPTGVTTRTGASTTVTLLFFTRTTLRWYNPTFVFDQDKTLITSALASETSDTTPTLSSEESGATDAETSEFTSTEAIVTSIDAVPTAESGVAIASESAGVGTSDNLPQAAVIGISVGISVLSFAVLLGVVFWLVRRRRRGNDARTSTEIRSPSWEPKSDGMYGQGHQTINQTPNDQALTAQVVPNTFPIPDLAHHEHHAAEVMAGQQPAHQPQPVYNAYHPSMGALNQQQQFAVELPTDNYHR